MMPDIAINFTPAYDVVITGGSITGNTPRDFVFDFGGQVTKTGGTIGVADPPESTW